MNGAGTIQYPYTKKVVLNPYFLPHKNKLTWNYLSMKPKNVKLLEKDIGKNVCDPKLSKEFLEKTQKAQNYKITKW